MGEKAPGLSPGKLVTLLERECHWEQGFLMILLSESVLSHFYLSFGVKVPRPAPQYPLHTWEELSGGLGCPETVIVVLQLCLRLFEPLCVWALTFFSFLQQGPEGPGKKPFLGVVIQSSPSIRTGAGCAPAERLHGWHWADLPWPWGTFGRLKSKERAWWVSTAIVLPTVCSGSGSRAQRSGDDGCGSCEEPLEVSRAVCIPSS